MVVAGTPVERGRQGCDSESRAARRADAVCGARCAFMARAEDDGGQPGDTASHSSSVSSLLLSDIVWTPDELTSPT
ncbi:hypothetical protein [Streptomyces sp. NPDC059761]|uniref:hypothetical protein n=1 Tax=Streptomyces sp. NPDC059761 TaxID=3346937 RepID=UPI0036695AC7